MRCDKGRSVILRKKISRLYFQTMKRRTIIIIGVALLLMIGGLSINWLLTRTVPNGLQTAKFIGFTNGEMGSLALTFSTQRLDHAAFVKQWIEAGTNALVFHVTNQQSFEILLGPYATFQGEATTQSTFVVNAPTLYGIALQPGQVANVLVATLPLHESARVQFDYTRDYYNFIPRLRAQVIDVINRTNTDFHTELFYSDWIND